MNKQHTIIKGTMYLTITGFISRIIGFFYRIFLSHTIGAEGMGIYQLISPVYVLCFALTVSGIHTGISRFTSAKLIDKDSSSPIKVLYAGLILSVIPSIILAYVVFCNSQFIAVNILKEPRCLALLKIISLSIPFGAVHSCINGYYFGIKKAGIPAFSQLVEQCVRVGSVFLIYNIITEKGITVTPALAAAGMVFGEIASVLFTITALIFQNSPPLTPKTIASIPHSYYKNIYTLSLPLTGNKVIITIIQGFEAVLIPVMLKAYGLSHSEALSIYGVLTGMSLALILFPSTITNSLSVMLLPDVASAQASNNYKKVSYTTQNTIKYCLILGILCTGIFLSFGNDMGEIIFNNELSGDFIVTLAWICPFLYLSTTLSSILHGLGKTFITFIHNIIALSIRIVCIILFVPVFGIQGYLWGVLIGQLAITLLSMYVLKKTIPLYIPLQEWLLKPAAALCISIFAGIYTKLIIYKIPFPFEIINVGLSCLIVCIVYFILLCLQGIFVQSNSV